MHYTALICPPEEDSRHGSGRRGGVQGSKSIANSLQPYKSGLSCPKLLLSFFVLLYLLCPVVSNRSNWAGGGSILFEAELFNISRFLKLPLLHPKISCFNCMKIPTLPSRRIPIGGSLALPPSQARACPCFISVFLQH